VNIQEKTYLEILTLFFSQDTLTTRYTCTCEKLQQKLKYRYGMTRPQWTACRTRFKKSDTGTRTRYFEKNANDHFC
jgi:hypothetical protein